MSNNTEPPQLVLQIGVVWLLGVAFVVLKLCGVIEWSWLWVLAPFWGPLALVVVVAVFGVACIAVGSTLKNKP